VLWKTHAFFSQRAGTGLLLFGGNPVDSVFTSQPSRGQGWERKTSSQLGSVSSPSSTLHTRWRRLTSRPYLSKTAANALNPSDGSPWNRTVGSAKVWPGPPSQDSKVATPASRSRSTASADPRVQISRLAAQQDVSSEPWASRAHPPTASPYLPARCDASDAARTPTMTGTSPGTSYSTPNLARHCWSASTADAPTTANRSLRKESRVRSGLSTATRATVSSNPPRRVWRFDSRNA
jgi:hypothetical protein